MTMKTNDDLIPVCRFIAESEGNIEIGNAIYEQYENAREDILKGFFKRLLAGIKQKLPDWSGRYTEPFFTKRYGAFDFYKSTWSQRYRIRLEAWDWGNGIVYGVWRDADSLPNVPLNAKLLAEVQEKMPDATSRGYYEAEIRMNSPAKDWRIPRVLWRLHSDEAFRTEVESLLIELAEIAAAHIDLMEKQNPKNKK